MGNPPVRPDQALQVQSRAGTGPAPQNTVFIGRLVVIFGTGKGAGLFVYSGKPGLGNPPVLSIVAPGVTSDPYGNPVLAVLNIGNFSAAHVGIDDNGNIFLANSLNQNVIELQPGKQAELFYTGGAGLGNLAVSISAADGSQLDASGNTFDGPGVEIQNGGSLWVAGPAGQQIVMSAASGLLQEGPAPIMVFQSGRPEESNSARITQRLVNSGMANEVIQLFISSAQVTAQADEAYIVLDSSPADASSTAGGSLNYLDTAATIHRYLAWGAFGVEVFCSFAGDTNTYQAERLTLLQGSAQTVNSATPAEIMQTAELGVGTYYVDGQVVYTPNQAAGAAEFEFGGSATVAGMGLVISEIALGTPTAPGNSAILNAFGPASFFTGALFGGAERVATVKGTIEISAAGTFAMFAACTVAADTYAVRLFGTELSIYPVGG